LPIVLVLVLVAVMGFARIYAGHHWASDVIAGALLGSLWLAIAVRIYCWGRSGAITAIWASANNRKVVPSKEPIGQIQSDTQMAHCPPSTAVVSRL
jgi:hypothetical protein